MDIHGKIREVLAETMREDRGSAHRSLSEADFLRALQRRGIVDDVMKDLHFTQVAGSFNFNCVTSKPRLFLANRSVFSSNLGYI